MVYILGRLTRLKQLRLSFEILFFVSMFICFRYCLGVRLASSIQEYSLSLATRQTCRLLVWSRLFILSIVKGVNALFTYCAAIKERARLILFAKCANFCANYNQSSVL